ncbi:ankyrin repeat protein [Seminavis robusta]|uniref:Ankyrin repeat protein n=1 Tax=Seminavis robusta TaxID=568900 RepID=A0A9N8DLM5_9STRA|nr:ankyrin repeat protein [Seminavis robusta]|eukprot:Sro213_g088360.1 ankyrin repeat protein (205) ;mRNA; r:21689-22303
MSSDSIATGIGTVASTAANSSANNNKKQKMSPPFESLVFADDLIWIGQILPFVGIGQYGFVGAVNKKIYQLYKDYCKIELKKNPREVKDNPDNVIIQDSRPAEITDTLYSETFCNVPRAAYWRETDRSIDKAPDPHQFCNSIAKIGNIVVMEWARQQGFPWNDETCACAAGNGHLEMLQWLREKGCPWARGTCAAAAQNGHLEI